MNVLPAAFLAFSLAWFSLIAFILHTRLVRRAAVLTLGAFALWLLYSATLAYQGWLDSPHFPPRVLLVLAPLVLYTIWLTRSRGPLPLVRALTLRQMVGLQAFRVPVELFLDSLWRAGLLPEGMTWHGHNYDIVTGVSAVALYLAWDRIPQVAAVAKAWNYMGLALLAQVAVTGILSAPGPQHVLNRETPNLAVISFPYVLIASLFVVSALTLHVLALRKIRNPST